VLFGTNSWSGILMDTAPLLRLDVFLCYGVSSFFDTKVKQMKQIIKYLTNII
jgi:hypothetical protein